MSSWKNKNYSGSGYVGTRRNIIKPPIPLEFTTTACNRKVILMQTYQSFIRNLQGVDWSKSTLYINVDPLPDKDNIEAIEKMAIQIFGKVTIRYGKGSAAEANRWTLSQPKGKYFFNLEDDWVLTEKINIHDMIAQLERFPQIMQSYLLGSNIEEGRPTLMPSLMRRAAIQTLIRKMNTKSNYEQQMISIYEKLGKIPMSMRYGSKKYVHDIGREWMKKEGFIRINDNDTWERNGEEKKKNVEEMEEELFI